MIEITILVFINLVIWLWVREMLRNKWFKPKNKTKKDDSIYKSIIKCKRDYENTDTNE